MSERTLKDTVELWNDVSFYYCSSVLVQETSKQTTDREEEEMER